MLDSMSAVFWRHDSVYAGELMGMTDEDVLAKRGVPQEHFKFTEPALYVPTIIQDSLTRVAKALDSAADTEVLFITYQYVKASH